MKYRKHANLQDKFQIELKIEQLCGKTVSKSIINRASSHIYWKH